MTSPIAVLLNWYNYSTTDILTCTDTQEQPQCIMTIQLCPGLCLTLLSLQYMFNSLLIIYGPSSQYYLPSFRCLSTPPYIITHRFVAVPNSSLYPNRTYFHSYAVVCLGDRSPNLSTMKIDDSLSQPRSSTVSIRFHFLRRGDQ